MFMENKTDRRQRNLILAITLSLFLHIILFFIIEYGDWLQFTAAEVLESPKEMVVTFPENKPFEKPREIVENINENEETPEESNLLSDRNSRARNPEKTDQTGDDPLSKGDAPFSNLSRPQQFDKSFKPPGFKKFSSSALTGTQPATDQNTNRASQNQQPSQRASLGTNTNLDQKDFSIEELGPLTLSTYQWDYAPYINALRRKLHRVWNVPPAFHMGLISGHSVILFEINKDGTLLNIKLLEHQGHESLEIASMESIKALFPFRPLPESFPEETLKIAAKLHYPNLKNRR